MAIQELGYLRLSMKDPQGWADFGESIMGFGKTKNADGDADACYLRLDEAPFRYIIEKGEADCFVAAGYGVADEAAFETLIGKVEAAGVAVARGDAAGAKHRAVAGYASFSDPSGNLVEVFYGRAAGSSFTPGCGISAFVTDPMGLGHLVLPAPENQATIDFYMDVVGFGNSDDLMLPPPAEGMPEQRIYFMHADNPRHHTLGLYNFPSPTGVVHVMAELSSIDEVGACMDRVKQAGLHIFASLGRHSNDEMVSFYFFGPGGIGIEVGYDGKQIEDWSQFTPTKSTIGDIWGHEYDFPVME